MLARVSCNERLSSCLGDENFLIDCILVVKGEVSRTYRFPESSSGRPEWPDSDSDSYCYSYCYSAL